MSIDWSKAPEGYDFHINWSDVSDCISSGFYRKEGYRYVKPDGAYTGLDLHQIPGLILTKRPEWNGKCLPPVGTVCECAQLHNNWVKGEVISHHWEGAVVAVGDSEKGFEYDSYQANQLRPLRTAEQIAAEERKAAIEEMVFGPCGCEPDGGNTNAFMICGFLYDAGYRKQEQK